MRGVARRVSEWVDVAAALLEEPVGVLPVETIATELRRTFDSPSVSFNWWSEGGVPGIVVPTRPGDVLAGRPVVEVEQMARDALESGLLDAHPLLRWFAVTGRPEAWSMGRVPAVVAGPRAPELFELFDSVDLRQQLSVPVVLCGRAHEAFVITRPDREDFSDEDVVVAQRVQKLLRALRVQVGAVARLLPETAPSGIGGVLTARELAVLELVVRGWTATAIGHHLGMSPRTASKHIEHIYRKLHVRDRVSAALTAERLGLTVGAPPTPRPPGGAGLRRATS